MAILEMDKIYIYGLNSQRKGVLESLHKSETVEITDITCEEDGLLKKETAKSIQSFTEYIVTASQALEILSEYFPEKTGMFTKRIESDESHYSMNSHETEKVNKHIYDIIRIRKTIRENEENISKITLKQSQLTPYLSLDIPMKTSGTDTTVAKLGTIEGKRSQEDITKIFLDNNIDRYYFEILSSSVQQTCVWFIFSKDIEPEMMQALRSMGFTEPPFIPSRKVCREKYEALEKEKQELIKQNEEYKASDKYLKGYLSYRDEIKLFYDHLVMRREKYEALSNIGLTENAFVISGYIPKKETESIVSELEKNFDVACEVEKANRDEAPVAFSNNGFSSPVEGITSDYSMPSANDIDPNPIMSVFYYFFFGMMFSDAGYGLLMMIACAVLGFGRVMEKQKRRAYKMFFYCGVSTTFWGIMYGSFFGDMIDTIAKTYFNSPFRLKPILLNPTEKPLELLIISVAFGMIHILTALGIKFYMDWRSGHKADAICDTGFWFAALVGICAFAGSMAGVAILKPVGIVLMAIGFGGLLVTGGRNSSNIIGKIFGGVLKLYDITSYVGDALSYSRLMALGLATGVIASVINVLGSLGGASVVGVISYIAISVFGHAMNFAINCLGAYVHTNRLQYVEFYQKFYEGGGRKFKPLSMNTKYYNFSKDK